ncbi:hypothetical protein ACXR0O_27435 [Verrucomicrobiota bacterium sgz303538]
MFPRILLCTLIACLALSSCSTPYKKRDEQEQKERTGEVIKDQTGDTSFQAFLGRLRTGVAKHDRVTLSTMITKDFGYRWDPAPAGETPFDYWDQNLLWTDVEDAMRSNFFPHEQYMVSEATARGYRAGLRMVGGSWKFAYFVIPEEAAQ